MCKVSIITPAYNAASFLQETVASIQSQSFKDWELIIADDSSTDDTYQTALALSKNDNRIKVIRNDKNVGVAVTRNNAIDVASGDFIAFLDSDDLWLPEKLERQLSFMIENNYVLTYTAYQKFDTNSGIRGKVVKAKNKMRANDIYGDTSIGCLTVIVNRKAVGPFHMPLLRHTEDNCTWQKILSRGYTAYGLNEILALYREGSFSLTSSKRKAVIQQWQTYREYYKFSKIKSAYYFFQYAINALIKHI